MVGSTSFCFKDLNISIISSDLIFLASETPMALKDLAVALLTSPLVISVLLLNVFKAKIIFYKRNEIKIL